MVLRPTYANPSLTAGVSRAQKGIGLVNRRQTSGLSYFTQGLIARLSNHLRLGATPCGFPPAILTGWDERRMPLVPRESFTLEIEGGN